jgi:ABC-type transporter Mla subunit MlaD
MNSATTVLSELAGRRRDLGEAMADLERVATAADRDQERWVASVDDKLLALRGAFVRHVSLVEGDEGLFQDVVDATPRLAHRVDAARSQHEQIADALDDAGRALRSSEESPGEVLEKVLALLGVLTRHRLAICDLAWEAFGVDLGSTD